MGWMEGWMIEFVGSPSLGSGTGEFLERFNMEDEMCNFYIYNIQNMKKMLVCP